MKQVIKTVLAATVALFVAAVFMPLKSGAVLLAWLETYHGHKFRFSAVGESYPTLEQFAANVAAVIGKIEVIEQELYDRIVYPTAGLNQFAFFTTPRGAGFSSETGNAGNTKTDADTNMTQNGQLPAPQAFWIDNLQIDFDPGSSAATVNTYVTQQAFVSAAAPAAATGIITGDTDKWAILNAGWAQLVIGQKPYYQNGPLAYFPPRSQKRIDAAVGGNSATTANFAAKAVFVDGDLRQLDPGLGLATGFNFGLNINFPVLVATPSALNGRLKVMLGGWLFRAAQ